jgi:hypothetical protein
MENIKRTILSMTVDVEFIYTCPVLLKAYISAMGDIIKHFNMS